MKKKATYDPEIRSHVITVRMNEEEWSAFQSQRKKLGERRSRLSSGRRSRWRRSK